MALHLHPKQTNVPANAALPVRDITGTFLLRCPPKSVSGYLRTRASRNVITAIHTKAQKGQMALPLDTILGSVCHLHANRLLRSSAGAQEAVIYHLLVRLYRLMLAQTK